MSTTITVRIFFNAKASTQPEAAVQDGSPCTMSKSLVRNVLFVLLALFHWVVPLIGFLALLIEPIAVITNPMGWRYGDRWAETQVVELEPRKRETR
ncbi:MAG: hypothetical protein AB1767_05215 [Bacillota bacterium]